MKSQIDLIQNQEFVYITGSLVFDKEEKLNFKNPQRGFYSMYHSMAEFSGIIDYITRVFSQHTPDLNSRMDLAFSIDQRINQFFLTYLSTENRYVYYRPEKNLLLYLGFGNNSYVMERKTKEILIQDCWERIIEFFLG